MNNNYFALTIGPVYDTFAQAKKTRTVWASSYFFSWFIKQVLIKTKKEGFEIMLPYHGKIMESVYGAGMYADRIYFVENAKGSLKDLHKILITIINDITVDICTHTHHKDADSVKSFLNSYLNLHSIELSVDAEDSNKDEDSVLMQLNTLLDNKELQKNFSFEFDENPLLDYLESEISSGSLLTLDAFDDLTGKRFRSIPEIASTSLDRINQVEYRKLINASFKINKPIDNNKKEFELSDELKKSAFFSDTFRPYHKYFGVLYADGDNISELLEKVAENKQDLLRFSELLMDFAKKAETTIVDYGGNGIYLGGEDILAFIPMACVNKEKNELQTVFSLVQQLDNHFYNTLGKYAEEKKVTVPTLSYGIMISYIKYPLKESMLIAHQLLESAKDKKKHSDKNTIGLRFQKHSGQVMECFIEKTENKSGSWEEIRKHTAYYIKNALKEKQKDLLSGIMHRFNEDLFYTTFTHSAKEGRAGAFFANFFDEDIHKTTEKDAYLRSVRNLAEIILKEYGYENPNSRAILFSVLRLVHFINSEKE